MNGYEAARAIRAASRSDAVRIPIIAITANAFSEDVKMALAAGMNAHIAKPFELRLLKKNNTSMAEIRRLEEAPFCRGFFFVL